MNPRNLVQVSKCHNLNTPSRSHAPTAGWPPLAPDGVTTWSESQALGPPGVESDSDAAAPRVAMPVMTKNTTAAFVDDVRPARRVSGQPAANRTGKEVASALSTTVTGGWQLTVQSTGGPADRRTERTELDCPVHRAASSLAYGVRGCHRTITATGMPF